MSWLAGTEPKGLSVRPVDRNGSRQRVKLSRCSRREVPQERELRLRMTVYRPERRTTKVSAFEFVGTTLNNVMKHVNETIKFRFSKRG